MRHLFLKHFYLLILFILINSCSSKEQKSIVIMKWTTHPALDQLENGVLESLVEASKKDQDIKNIVVERFNANGDMGTATALASTFNKKTVKLVVAIATPAAQAVSKELQNIPMVYGAVADPEGAKIIPSNKATGIQNAGLEIVENAFTYIKNILSKDSTILVVGTIYNPGEQNSQKVQDWMQEAQAKIGKIRLIQLNVTEPTEVTIQALDLINRKVDVIYSANDNTVNRAANSLASLCRKKGVPFIIGDLSTLKCGALAAVGLEYRSMGREIGRMAVDILHGKKIENIPPQKAPIPQKWLNVKIAKELRINITNEMKNLTDSLLVED